MDRNHLLAQACASASVGAGDYCVHVLFHSSRYDYKPYPPPDDDDDDDTTQLSDVDTAAGPKHAQVRE